MARFYVGQPVVCVRPSEEWDGEDYVPRDQYPTLGHRYTVDGYLSGHVSRYGTTYMKLRELNPLYWYDEAGFAPITGEQVRVIIEGI